MMRSEHRARRLDATLCHIFYLAVMLVLAGLAAGLCVTNLHKFHVALTARHQAEQDNHWLAQQTLHIPHDFTPGGFERVAFQKQN